MKWSNRIKIVLDLTDKNSTIEMGELGAATVTWKTVTETMSLCSKCKTVLKWSWKGLAKLLPQESKLHMERWVAGGFWSWTSPLKKNKTNPFFLVNIFRNTASVDTNPNHGQGICCLNNKKVNIWIFLHNMLDFGVWDFWSEKNMLFKCVTNILCHPSS